VINGAAVTAGSNHDDQRQRPLVPRHFGGSYGDRECGGYTSNSTSATTTTGQTDSGPG
jgi:hypothetical protein